MPHISTAMRTVSKGSAKPAWALFQVGWLTLANTSPVALATEPSAKAPATKVSLVDGRWRLNGELTYRGAKAEGLLMNVRMVNAFFVDANNKTRPKQLDPDANTEAFIQKIPAYAAGGVRAFTLNVKENRARYLPGPGLDRATFPTRYGRPTLVVSELQNPSLKRVPHPDPHRAARSVTRLSCLD